MVSRGVRPAPVLPVTALTKNSSASPSAASGTIGEQHRRREAAGMRCVRRLDARELFRHGAGELLEPSRRLVRVAVDGGIRGRIGETEVGRCVDDDELGAGARGRRQQAVDEAGRCAVRRGRQQQPARRRVEPFDDGVERDEPRVGVGRREVREGLRHRLAGLARGHDAAERELGVRLR